MGRPERSRRWQGTFPVAFFTQASGKRLSRVICLATMLGDLLALALAFHGSVRLRVALNPLFRAQMDELHLQMLVPPLGLVILLWLAGSGLTGLYGTQRGRLKTSAVRRAMELVLLVVGMTIVVTFFVRDFGRDFSRSFVLFLAALGVVAILVNRMLIWSLVRLLKRWGFGQERILVVGRGRGAKVLTTRLERAATGSHRVVGVVSSGAEASEALGNPVPVLGSLAALPCLINQHGINRVIAVEQEVPVSQMHACESVCARMDH